MDARCVSAGVLAAGLLLVGCGRDAPRRPQGPPVAQGRTVNVMLSDYRLSPAVIRIPQPTTVDFKVRNTGQKTHALRVDGPPPSLMVETLDLKPGKSEVITVDLFQPGRYSWYCPYHQGQGMTGTIIVGRPGERPGAR